MTTNNTLAQKAARRKLSLLQLASDLDNVRKACKIMCYSQEQFYEIRRNYQTFGADELLDNRTISSFGHIFCLNTDRRVGKVYSSNWRGNVFDKNKDLRLINADKTVCIK